ncbi:UDP-N-acetylglucosamine 2-epimerase (non-hydrolyzing) [Kamptonema cortianum]|nr:UDP-N-acetylglucosamine 2-epimerase (non-hydrolyzing) [Oscillatoria laete-virens]MDK3155400.1 UDP-N-acetylglucosamine 2-epimerase (non-hydrolyzing) [Kamptonema cortianum]MDL5046147.1 UDP-N-acetylglucosamine 2-epimerase (non-hydrolyzing) [Oscillatoria amoena NRMC-F 0135]MDL5052845.1 UDP-N-acetylglucosamine 2-epimerase (non-hydrolyzing) [Oscillatoria laete-virens NRMC-F 0139]
MKIMTVLGTRPEIIRLSRIIPLLDKLSEHFLLHTNQNFDRNLSEIFFQELKVREPDVFLGHKFRSAMDQVGHILSGCEEHMGRFRPDRILILGDTNSGLAAYAAKRLGIPVYHMEAGNRCYDDRVPEEVNRRVIDHCSDVLMPYTERSRANLLREGIPGHRIFVTGNPIKEVLDHYSPQIARSKALTRFGVKKGGYFLATLHRAENVDLPDRLDSFVGAFNRLCTEHGKPLVWSVHPRTREKLGRSRVKLHKLIRVTEPLGFFDFVRLEKEAFCALSDSGTVQEECSLFRVPNVTIRDVTERPETVECGSNILGGANPDDICRAVQACLETGTHWTPPEDYLMDNVSRTVVKLLLSYRHTPV